MTLADLLSPARVLIPLPASSLENAVRLLAQACVADGVVRDPERLEAVVSRSWPEDTMTLGPNAFLPHFRTDAVDRLVAALGVAPEALAAGGREPREARIVLLVLAPPRQAAAYLQAVAAFARALAEPDTSRGLLAARTAAEALALPAFRDMALAGQLRVRDLMTTDVVAVTPDVPLGEAARLLVQHGVEALPVVNPSGEVIGMVSNRELLRYLVPPFIQRVSGGEARPPRRSGETAVDPAALPVRDAMERSVLCLSADQSIADVAQLIANKDLARFPVTQEGVLRGFITRADIVRKIIGR